MTKKIAIGVLLTAVVLVYANTLRNGFTLDDGLYISNNPQVTAPSARTLFAPNTISNVFRPVTFATFALNWAVGSARPLGFHLVNLILHAGVTILLYLILLEIFGSWPQAATVAFAAALIFAVHPLHTEAVASIVGRSELLAAGFLFAAWFLHLRDRTIPALLCFFLAVLSKESAIGFLGLVLIGDYVRGSWKPRLRYALIAGVTLLYLAALWKLQGGRFGQATIFQLDNPLAGLPVGWRILNALRVAWKYIGLHLYPATLSYDYSFNQIPVYSDWRHTLPAAVAALIVLVAWVWALRKRHVGLALAGGIYLVGFAATANILVPTGTIMGERLAYLPSAGFCLLLALGLIWLKDRQQTVAYGILGLLVLALGARTVIRNADWKDNLALFTSAVHATPESAKVHANLGSLYLSAGQLDLARSELQIALKIYPNFPDAMESYGLVESRSGNYQTAGWMMERALQMSARNNPNYDYMAVNFAGLLMQTGHTDAALDLLNREITESPQYARAWANRAVIHYQRGEAWLSRTDAETALRLDPNNAQAQNVLRLLPPALPNAFPK